MAATLPWPCRCGLRGAPASPPAPLSLFLTTGFPPWALGQFFCVSVLRLNCSPERGIEHISFPHLQPLMPKALKVVKVLVGMASAAGETNPTPWFRAVTLPSPESAQAPIFRISSVSQLLFYPSQPAHQHHQKGGRDYTNAAARVLLVPTFLPTQNLMGGNHRIQGEASFLDSVSSVQG